MGDEVGTPRQDFPDAADSGGDMLDTVDDGIVVITEDQITVFAHQLHDQRLVTQIPHFVEMLDIDMHNSFQARLGDVHNTAVLQVLAQKHTEVGGRHGAGFIGFRQIDQRKGSTGGQKQSLLPCGLLDGQQQFIVLRLGDLVQPSADQFLF